ncbi:Hypothetical Protein FCC1311_099922 [Hondaea fermentalgiana]|uniref:Uncharacterized protein n=1 Tax=Hondaea fermentalgiana TaxID=2315210 RepID=A0A2R5GTX1_9STRA|nr:Hypothetical Protein FCC1311_099922 [Hondaea fermentalgiana]|eukprot:GBG33769.1 Hypothetical Protein FCC1311_099922 [Hondaea fermentalgiana]
MSVKKVYKGRTWVTQPGEWEQEKHYYPRALNAQLHPLVQSFMSLDKKRLAMRYCHLHPEANQDKLLEVLSYKPSFFKWSGADLFCVTNESANRQMIVIETNSCPSGQKSMPAAGTNDAESSKETGYYRMVAETFGPLLKEKDADLPDGVFAVIFDKNPMEATGYAQCMSDYLAKTVFCVEFFKLDKNPPAKWTPDGVLLIRVKKADLEKHYPEKVSLSEPCTDEEYSDYVWVPVKAAFRYVTIAPWSRIPIVTKTLVLNPIISCLSGGRNKLVASKSYDFLNAELAEYGLTIRAPETISDVSLTEIPLYLKSMGYVGVIKVPYSNAGQGVFTITSKAELDEFMEWAKDTIYDQYIVQALVGNSTWSSRSTGGTFYHVGTIPNSKYRIYVADVRMMICATDEGYRPLAIYARRAAAPLAESLDGESSSWDMLGTNLSIAKPDGTWDSDTGRLLLMDRKDFNKLGLSVDDLVDGFIQCVMASTAIDQMCKRLLKHNKFDQALFSSLNKDPGFMSEVFSLEDMAKKEEAEKAAEEN